MPDDIVYPHEGAHTTLINIQNSPKEEMDIYIGEEHKSYGLQPSLFRNPFDEAEMDREEAAQHFKMYFYRRYLKDEKFRKKLHSIEGKTLGCLCYPKRCHGEIIVDLLNKHEAEGIEGSIKLISERLDENIEKENLGPQGFKEYEAAKDAVEEVREEYEI